MCILCELVLDAGWAKRLPDGDLAETCKGHERLAELVGPGTTLEYLRPAYEAMREVKRQAQHEAHDDNDDRMLEAIVHKLRDTVAMQGNHLSAVAVGPANAGPETLASISEQIEMGKLAGLVSPSTEVDSLEVNTIVTDGKIYAWNVTMLQLWCQQQRERIELWHVVDTGLLAYLRNAVEQERLNLLDAATMTLEDAQRVPIIVGRIDALGTGLIMLDGKERAMRLLLAQRGMTLPVIELTSDEVAQFLIVDGEQLADEAA